MKLILILVSVIQLSAAAVYFGQSSAGANNGTSCTDRIALSGATWTAGNTYHLCGTVTSQVNINASGSAGNPITLIWETGAKISQGACTATGCVRMDGRAYIVLDGGSNGIIEATNSGTGMGSATSIGVYARGGVNHSEIKNLAINGMYVHTADLSDVPGNDYIAIWMDGSDNTVHNNTIADAACGLCVEVTSARIDFYNNVVHGANWGVFYSGSGTTDSITSCNIYNNEIYDFTNWDTTVDQFHHDGIFISGGDVNTSLSVSHIDIYNNYLHGTISECCTTAYLYVNDANHIRIFNNLIVAPVGAQYYVNNGLILVGAGGYPDTDYSLYNNTVIGGTTIGSGGACIRVISQTRFIFENNVLSNCTYTIWTDSTTTYATLDYNVYQDASLSGTWRITGGSDQSTIAGWRTATGGDANGQATTGSLNLSGTYEPTVISILVGAGANLTSIGITALNSDKNGGHRPTSGAWTVGAYEFNVPSAIYAGGILE